MSERLHGPRIYLMTIDGRRVGARPRGRSARRRRDRDRIAGVSYLVTYAGETRRAAIRNPALT